MPQDIREFRVSNDAFDDPPELQRRLADEGYLFFRQLQDPDKMSELRRVMMTKIQDVGWLLPDTDPYDGIADTTRNCTEGDREYTAGYSQVYKLEPFHRSAHWPAFSKSIAMIPATYGCSPPKTTASLT